METDEVIGIRVSKNLKEKASEKAKARGHKSLSEYIRFLIITDLRGGETDEAISNIR